MTQAKPAPNKKSDSISIQRATLGTTFGFVGIVGLLIAVVAFAWYLRFSVTVVVALAVGLVGLVAWAAIAPKEFVATMTGRQARYSTAATFAALLLLGIVTLVYIIVARANIAIDVTAARSFSLSDTTFEVLDRIPQGQTLQITGFYTSDDLQIRSIDDQWLRQYETESDGRVQVEYINPQEEPATAQRFGYRASGDLFVAVLADSGEVNFNTLTYVPRENKQERDVTNAIARMLNQRVLTVYFAENLTSLSVFEENEQGLTLLDNAMRASGIRTNTLNLAQLAANGDPIPPEANVLVIARPRLQLSQAEVDVVDAYLQRGGGLLVLTDIILEESEYFLQEGTVFHSYLAENYGLIARDAAVVDPPQAVNSPLEIIGAATFLEHPIGEALRGDIQTYFRIARALGASTEKPATVANGRIMSSSAQSYAEANLDALATTNTFEFDADADIQGPLDLVVWAWDEQGNDSKVVMIGDADFARNVNIDSGAAGNALLFLESVAWLSGTQEGLDFGFVANPSAIPTIFVSGQQLDLIGIVVIALVPLSVLFTGLIVWYRRTFA
jgi:ABC-type uncharacterized transport system involved in gliding motility auxiliary subunit